MRNLQWNLAVEKGERNHRVISKVRETKSAVETGVFLIASEDYDTFLDVACTITILGGGNVYCISILIRMSK